MSTTAPAPLDRHSQPWLFAVALVTALPHTLHQAAWLSLASALLIIWGGWLWWRDQRLPGRWLLVPLVGACSLAILAEYRTLFGREAGVALLLLFMALKLLELKSRRDGMVVIALGYFLLLTHYFHAQDIPTALWMLLSLWIVTASQIRLYSTGNPTPLDLLRRAASLGLQALPFMVVLYLLFPRINGPLWGLPQDAHKSRTGLSDTMAPGTIADMVQSGEIAFRVRFEKTPPDKSRLYWRGPVMENFDGTRWTIRRGPRRAEHVEAQSTPVNYETTLEAHGQRWLLALDAPTQLPEGGKLDGRQSAVLREPLTQRQRFSFASSIDYRLNAEEEENTLRANLNLPAGRNPRTHALARQWRMETDKPEAIIQRALQLFANRNFSYTLRPPLLGGNGIDDFLFTSQSGFCEHYAAAFVVLMRAAGIPARVVGGYQGGELNPLDGYLVIRQSDAHAWAEVWLENKGWIRVDPTAVVAPDRLASGIFDALDSTEPLPALLRNTWLRALRFQWEALNNAWNQQIIGYDLLRQRELLTRLGLASENWPMQYIALGLISIILMMLITIWSVRRRKQIDPAQRLWHKALRHLARRKVHCAPWETPYALSERVANLHPDMARPFQDVVEAYLAARYGTNNDLNTLRDMIARLP